VSELPKGWAWANLSEVSFLINGDRGKNYPSKSAFSESGIPFINAGHLVDGHIDCSDMNYITEEHFTLLSNGKIQCNDILYCIRGSLGKIALVTNIEKGAIASSLVIIRPLQKKNSKYLYYFLISPYGKNEISKYDNGSAQPNLSATNVGAYQVPLPPLNEQRRIVAKIEALRARSQRVKEALEAIPPLLDQFRQSVLSAAFRGDLTADWREKNPDVEPASVLLEKIRAERRHRWEEAELEKMRASGKVPKDDRWKTKYEEPSSIEQQDFPYLPDGWYWIKLEELASDIPRSLQSGPFGSNLLHSEFQNTGILAIGIDNVLDGSFSLGRENRISSEKYKELEKYTARPLDVLITVMSTVGRCCVVPSDIETAIITKHVYRISPEQEIINSYFMMNALRGSVEVKSQLKEQVRGQTRPGINGQILRNLIIPVPSRIEQEEILKRIKVQFDKINQINTILNDLGVTTSLLDQSILTKAFRGELIRQDPNDEPAFVLLERIRAERAKLEASAKTPKKSTGKTGGRGRGKAKQQDAESVQLELPGLE